MSSFDKIKIGRTEKAALDAKETFDFVQKMKKAIDGLDISNELVDKFLVGQNQKSPARLKRLLKEKFDEIFFEI